MHADRASALYADTLPEAFQRTVSERPDAIAFRASGTLPDLTWAEYAAEVRTAAAVLCRLGVRRGDTVALLFTSRREFHFIDSAALHLGITSFSLYNSASLETMRFVLQNSGARVVITEAEFLQRAVELNALVDTVVVLSDRQHPLLDWATLAAQTDASFNLGAAAAHVCPDDVATLIYTAGTTGIPKGVELTHANITFAMRVMAQRMGLPVGADHLSFLPMAHAMARMNDHYVAMMLGFCISICSDPGRILEDLRVVRPSFFVSTPRVWEKLRADILGAVRSEPDEARQNQMIRAIEVGTDRVRAEQKAFAAGCERRECDRPPAEAALVRELTRRVGLDRIVASVIGGAPVDADMIEFFHAVDVSLGEAFGMSESSSVCTGNPPSRVRFGTVGPPLDGVTVQLADDGEILIQGPNVMRGYRGMPALTADAIDANGWLHTGDIGRRDDDGYLRIVDRKKDIIINSAGKNISPALIQTALVRATPLIQHAVAIGDRRPYVVALLTLDHEGLFNFASDRGIQNVVASDLAEHPTVIKELDAAIAAANSTLARPEQVKRYRIVCDEWLPGGDELTPTMKVKRASIVAKYAGIIDAMYDVSGPVSQRSLNAQPSERDGVTH